MLLLLTAWWVRKECTFAWLFCCNVNSSQAVKTDSDLGNWYGIFHGKNYWEPNLPLTNVAWLLTYYYSTTHRFNAKSRSTYHILDIHTIYELELAFYENTYMLGVIVLKYSGHAMRFGQVLGQHLWQLSWLAWEHKNVNATYFLIKGIKIWYFKAIFCLWIVLICLCVY